MILASALAAVSCYEDTAGETDPRNAVSVRTIHAWPGGTIHYNLEGSFTEDEREYITYAMNEWSQKTPVTFIAADTVKENEGEVKARVLRIGYTEGESYATVGYAEEPVLMISSSDRLYLRYIVQLFGHVIGLLNEHQRPDRDDYIVIHWENISSDAAFHYVKLDSSLIIEENFPYDTSSVMHYTRTQGSKEFALRSFDYLYQDFDSPAHYVSDGDIEKVTGIYSSKK